MTFKQRLPYYLVGLFFGVVIVFFIWDKKGTEFNYGPNARVLKNISTKQLIFSEEIKNNYRYSDEIDSLTILKILKNGNVDMWNKIQYDSCTQYNIKGKKELKNITITVKNCDSTAIVEKIIFQ
jgi:hypothetical protein